MAYTHGLLTVLAVVLPILQSLSPVWIAMALVSLCAWALIAAELRPRKERKPAGEEPAPGQPRANHTTRFIA